MAPRNHLEPNLDAGDNLFTYDNTDDGLGWWTRVTHHIDGGYYGYPWDYHTRKDRMLDQMAEYGGGSPCGGVFYKEDAWPEKYRGRGFWSEWGQRKVRAFKFKPKGATFEVEDVVDFIQPDLVSDFRPLDLALSYDGKIMYVADWGYGGWNNKTEKLGRVYAVEYTGEIKPSRPRGKDTDSIADQIKQLDHPSYNEREAGRSGALVKKGKAAEKALMSALGIDPKTDPLAIASPRLSVERDYRIDLTAIVPFLLVELTKDPSPDVPQVPRLPGPLSKVDSAGTSAYATLAKGLRASDPNVRLYAAIGMGRMPDVFTVEPLVPLVADADPYVAFSARTALKRIHKWQVAAEGLNSPDAGIRAGVMLATEMTYDLDATKALAAFTGDSSRDPSERARALFLLAEGHRKPIPWDGKWWGTQPAQRKPPAKSIDWDGTPVVLTAVRDRLADPSVPVRRAAVTAEAELHDPTALPILRARFDVSRFPEPRAEIAKVLGTLGIGRQGRGPPARRRPTRSARRPGRFWTPRSLVSRSSDRTSRSRP